MKSDENKPKLRNIVVFDNGMVACFDIRGKQIAEIQGVFEELKTTIQEYASDYWLDVEVSGVNHNEK